MKIDQILNLFNLGPLENKVFQVCLESGMTGATVLAKKANISRTAIYDILESLIKEGLIIESQKSGIKVFTVQKPEAIELLINEKQKEILMAKTALVIFKNEYYSSDKLIKPRLQFFEGQEELRQMMKDLLLYRDITAYVLWPVEKIIKLLGIDFYRDFHKKRTEQNIQIKVIWPRQQVTAKIKYDFFKDDVELKREIRIAPKNIDFSLGYTIYADTVRFISSQKENYGFLIESQEMAEMMKQQFEIIWAASKKI
ncbi:MAG: helix-turn-helix domain-containing protein [Candidatus Uhrbacteria bacterium]